MSELTTTLTKHELGDSLDLGGLLQELRNLGSDFIANCLLVVVAKNEFLLCMYSYGLAKC